MEAGSGEEESSGLSSGGDSSDSSDSDAESEDLDDLRKTRCAVAAVCVDTMLPCVFFHLLLC